MSSIKNPATLVEIAGFLSTGNRFDQNLMMPFLKILRSSSLP